jgi:four helix bundle protein
MNKIKTFTDLIAWQKGHELVLTVYLLTKKFPDTEKFGLLVQMRRSASSITANLAEGFGRRGLADKTRFYDIAIGSLYELQDQLLIAKDLNYFSLKEYTTQYNLSEDVQRLINALIRSINK